MKRIILTATAMVALTLCALAQSPESMNYQSVVRDVSGGVIANQAVGMQFTILQGSATGTNVYQETFAPTTNTYGLVNLELGTGVVVSGTFASIDWSAGPYFIETGLDATGGSNFVVMGTSPLLSVPYALHAKTALNVTNDLVDDADADPTNEYNTTVVLNGTNLETTDAGGTITTNLSSLVNDADASTTNEIQTLAWNDASNTLSLSNGGGSVVIPTATGFFARKTLYTLNMTVNFLPITCDLEEYDDGNNYNPANGRFTAPQTGIYHFDINAMYRVNANDFSAVDVRVNNIGYCVIDNQRNYGGNGQIVSKEGGVTIKLTAGQYVTIHYQGDVGAGEDIVGNVGGSASTWWSGYRVH